MASCAHTFRCVGVSVHSLFVTENQKPTIFIASKIEGRTAFGKFPLERDEGGIFVILPENSKAYLSENLIRPGKETGADFLYACPVHWRPPKEK